MLYSIFMFQSQSGLILWQKSFEKQMDSNRMQMLSSFFSAIQSFVKEAITSNEKGLKNIEVANLYINITEVPKLQLEIVAIIDKEDIKVFGKVLPNMIQLLETHRQLFELWDGEQSKFNVLDLELLKIIQTEKQLLGSKSLLDGETEIIDSIVDRMPELEKNQRENYQRNAIFCIKK